MTIETETQEEDFATFEARMNTGEPEAQENEEKPDNPETNDELELTEDDELVEEEESEKDDKKPRHKSAKDRIAELTREKHEERRRNAELEARIAALESGHKPDPQQKPAVEFKFDEPEPDPEDAEKYPFGDADPQYLKDMARYEGRKAFAEAKHEADTRAAAESQQSQARETFQNLDTSWAEAEARGAEKYEDFTEKVEDFKTNAPCPPLMAVAIQASPVAEDLTYHLASNQDQAEVIAATLLGGDLLGAARSLGEIEGQFMDKRPERPAANAHPADHALYAGRLKAFLAKDKQEKPRGKVMTDAPEPARHQARGSSGKFGVDDDTTDFGAFEKKYMGKR